MLEVPWLPVLPEPVGTARERDEQNQTPQRKPQLSTGWNRHEARIMARWSEGKAGIGDEEAAKALDASAESILGILLPCLG